MDIIDLLSKPSGYNYSVEEAQYIVERYIKLKKGRDVKINIYRDVDLNQLQLNPFGQMVLHQQTQMLFEAFNQATQNMSINDFKN